VIEVNKISKVSPIPLYIQVADSLREQIASGVYPPGSLLPNEQTLMQMYEASRVTIRNALDLLVEDGVIIKKQGKGSFVTDSKKTFSLTSLQGFYSLLVKSGAKVHTKLQSTSNVLPPKEISSALGHDEAIEVRKIERLYLIDNQPFALAVTHFYRDIDLQQEEAEKMVGYGILIEKLGKEPHFAKYSITASTSTSHLSKTMGIDKGSPILILNRITYSADSQPLEHARHYIRPDLCALEFQIVKKQQLEDLRIQSVDANEDTPQ